VRELVELAARELGQRIRWEGSGVDECGEDVDSERVLVRINPRYLRPTEVDPLLGDAGKARSKLAWTPRAMFVERVGETVTPYLEHARRDAMVARDGY